MSRQSLHKYTRQSPFNSLSMEITTIFLKHLFEFYVVAEYLEEELAKSRIYIC
jgi:hypothetical protein